MKMTEPWSSFGFLSQLVILRIVLRSNHPGFPNHACFHQTSLLIQNWVLFVPILFYHFGKWIYPFVVFVGFLLIVCICIHMHVHFRVCREQKLMPTVLLSGSLHYDWGLSLSLKRVPINHLHWLVSRLQDGSVSALSALMFQTHIIMPEFLYGCWEFMLRSYPCTVNTLSSELSTFPLYVFLTFKLSQV